MGTACFHAAFCVPGKWGQAGDTGDKRKNRLTTFKGQYYIALNA